MACNQFQNVLDERINEVATAIGRFICEEGKELFFENNSTLGFFKHYLPNVYEDDNWDDYRGNENFKQICKRAAENSCKINELKGLFVPFFDSILPLGADVFNLNQVCNLKDDSWEKYVKFAIKRLGQNCSGSLDDCIEQFRGYTLVVPNYTPYLIEILHNTRKARNRNTHNSNPQTTIGYVKWLIFGIFTIEALLQAIKENTCGVTIISKSKEELQCDIKDKNGSIIRTLNIKPEEFRNVNLKNEGNYKIVGKIMGSQDETDVTVKKIQPGEPFVSVVLFNPNKESKDYGVGDGYFSVYCTSGKNYFDNGKYDNAYEYYEKALERHQCKAILTKLAICQYFSGMENVAFDRLIDIVADESLDIDNTDSERIKTFSPEAHYWLAKLYYDGVSDRSDYLIRAKNNVDFARSLLSKLQEINSPYLKFFDSDLEEKCVSILEDIKQKVQLLSQQEADEVNRIDPETLELDRLGVPDELRNIPRIKDFYQSMLHGERCYRNSRKLRKGNNFDKAVDECKEALMYYEDAKNLYELNVVDTKIAACKIQEISIMKAQDNDVDDEDAKREIYNILGKATVERDVEAFGLPDIPSPEAFYWLSFMHLRNWQPNPESYNDRFQQAVRNLAKAKSMCKKQADSFCSTFLPPDFEGLCDRLEDAISQSIEDADQRQKSNSNERDIREWATNGLKHCAKYFSLLIVLAALIATWFLWDWESKMGLLLLMAGLVFSLAVAFEKIRLPKSVDAKEELTLGKFYSKTGILDVKYFTKYNLKECFNYTALWTVGPGIVILSVLFFNELADGTGLGWLCDIFSRLSVITISVNGLIAFLALLSSLVAVLYKKDCAWAGLIRQRALFPFAKYDSNKESGRNLFYKWMLWTWKVIIITLIFSYIAGFVFVKQPWKNIGSKGKDAVETVKTQTNNVEMTDEKGHKSEAANNNGKGVNPNGSSSVQRVSSKVNNPSSTNGQNEVKTVNITKMYFKEGNNTSIEMGSTRQLHLVVEPINHNEQITFEYSKDPYGSKIIDVNSKFLVTPIKEGRSMIIVKSSRSKQETEIQVEVWPENHPW